MRGARPSRRPRHSRERSRAGRKNGASQSWRAEGPGGDKRSQVRRGDGAAGLPGRRQLREGEFAGPRGHQELPTAGRKQTRALSAAALPAVRAPRRSPGRGRGPGAATRAGHSLSLHPPGVGPRTRTPRDAPLPRALVLHVSASASNCVCGALSPRAGKGFLVTLMSPALTTSPRPGPSHPPNSAEGLRRFLLPTPAGVLPARGGRCSSSFCRGPVLHNPRPRV